MIRKIVIVIMILLSMGIGFADDSLPLELLVGNVSEGAISPDGRQVLVVRFNETLRNYELSSFNIAMKKETGILTADFINSPRMDPQGKKIIFRGIVKSTGTDIDRLWVINADGSGLKPFLTSQPPETEERSPTWSPNGAFIAWTRNGVIWIARADGRNPEPLTVGGKGSYSTVLDWMDDTLLITSIDDNTSDYSLFLLDWDTGELTPTGLQSTIGVFDSSTDWILYGQGPLYLWDVNEERRDPDYLEISPSFPGNLNLTRSADGNRILFDAMDSEDTSINHLYLIDVGE